MISILFILLLLILTLIISKTIFRTLLSPLNFYLFIWLLLILLYLLDSVINIWGYLPLSREAWLLLVISIFSYFIGCISSAIPHVAIRKIYSIQSNTARFAHELQFYLPKITRISYICLFISFLSPVIKWRMLFDAFGNPLVMLGGIRRLAVYEKEFSFGNLISFLHYFGLCGIFLLGIVLGQENTKKGWLLFIMQFAVLFFDDLSLGSRGVTFFGFVLFIIALLLVRSSVRGVKLKIAPLGIGILFMLMLLHTIVRLRGGSVSEPFIIDFLKLLYLYATGPIPAFDASLHVMERAVPLQYLLGGLYRSLNSVSAGLGFGEIFALSQDYYPNVLIGPQYFNTVPWLSYLYSDLGIIGVILMPYVIGWFSTYIFFKYKSNPTLLRLTLLVLIYTYLLLTPRGTLTSWISFWFVGGVSTILSLYLQRRLRKARVHKLGEARPSL